MFDINKFESNSYYVIPFIIQNVDLLYFDTLYCVNIRKVGFNSYLEVKYHFTDKLQTSLISRMLSKEKNIYTTYEDVINDEVLFVARFKIPESKSTLYDTLSKIGEDYLSVKDLKKVYKYWKKVLQLMFDDKKSPATRESSRAYFYFSNCII